MIPAIWSSWFGAEGERVAARFLQQKGYKILARGYRTPLGEVDLICRDGNCVVFVEVKARKQGHPAEAVDRTKQARLTRAALHFLRRHDLLETAARFDVIAITWSEGQRPDQIEHFIDAFEPVGRWQMFH